MPLIGDHLNLFRGGGDEDLAALGGLVELKLGRPLAKGPERGGLAGRDAQFARLRQREFGVSV